MGKHKYTKKWRNENGQTKMDKRRWTKEGEIKKWTKEDGQKLCTQQDG